MIFRRIEGREGEVTIPSLGAIVAKIEAPTGKWTLVRREEGPAGESAVFSLHAVFSYVNEGLFKNEAFKKKFIVTIAKGKQYRLQQRPGGKTELSGRSLLMEGVELWPLD